MITHTVGRVTEIYDNYSTLNRFHIYAHIME